MRETGTKQGVLREIWGEKREKKEAKRAGWGEMRRNGDKGKIKDRFGSKPGEIMRKRGNCDKLHGKLREVIKICRIRERMSLEVFAHTYSAHSPRSVSCDDSHAGGYTRYPSGKRAHRLALLGRGIQCFIMRYSTFPARFPPAP